MQMKVVPQSLYRPKRTAHLSAKKALSSLFGPQRRREAPEAPEPVSRARRRHQSLAGRLLLPLSFWHSAGPSASSCHDHGIPAGACGVTYWHRRGHCSYGAVLVHVSLRLWMFTGNDGSACWGSAGGVGAGRGGWGVRLRGHDRR